MNYLIVLGSMSIIVIISNIFMGFWKIIYKNLLGMSFISLICLGLIAGLIDLL